MIARFKFEISERIDEINEEAEEFKDAIEFPKLIRDCAPAPELDIVEAKLFKAGMTPSVVSFLSETYELLLSTPWPTVSAKELNQVWALGIVLLINFPEAVSKPTPTGPRLTIELPNRSYICMRDLPKIAPPV